MISDQEFEEVKKLYACIRKLGTQPITEEEKELDRKWAPIDVVSILIESLDEARSKLKILTTPLSSIALQIEGYTEENKKFKEALRFYAGLEHDAHWDGNNFLTFNKFGHFDQSIMGPIVALEVLGEFKLK
jgi:hypothetical protein